MERFGDLIQGLDAIVWEMEADSCRFTFVSDVAERMIGYPVSRWLETPDFIDFVHPDDRERLLATARAAASAGKDHRQEYRALTPDGRTLWLRDIVRVIPARDGRPALLRGVTVDITEQKRAEERLTRSERQLSEAQQIALLGSWELDVTSGGVALSAELLRINGMRPDASPRTSEECFAIVHADDRARVREAFAATLRDGTRFVFDHRIVRPDGDVRMMSVRGEAVRDGSGRIVRVVGTAQDITDRYRAEESLRASDARLRRIAGAIQDAIYVFDITSGRYVYLSPSYEEMWGQTCETLYGDPDAWLGAVHPDDRARVKERLARVAASGYTIPWREEYRLVRPDGTVRWVWDCDTRMPDGDPPGLIVGSTRDVTERKLAEAALLEKDQELVEFIETAPLGLHWVAPDGVILWANRTQLDMLGYEAGEYVGHHVREFHPDRANVEEILARLARGEPVQERESRMRCRDGSIKHVLMSSSVRRKEGRLVHSNCFMKDITERKFAEQAMRESRERYEIVSRATNDVVWDWDLLTDEVVWNEAAQRAFGYPGGSIDSAWWEERLHPDDREKIMADVQEAVSAGSSSWSGEYRFRRADGSFAYVFDRGHIMRNGAGRAVRMIGSMVDLSDRRRVEEELRQSQERYAVVSRATNDAIWDWNVPADTVRWNEAIHTLFGYAPEHVRVEADWGDSLIHPADRRRVVRSLAALVTRGGTALAQEYRFLRADGSYAYVFDRSFAMRDENGRVVRVIGSMQDITARKRVEQSLREMSARLLRSQDEERRRLARDLHDSTAQNLAALTMNLAIVEKLSEKLPAVAKRKVKDSLALATQCVREVRTFSYLLHPPLLDESGLYSALRWFADGFAERSGLRVALRLPRNLGRLPGEIETALFRIVQESLTNVMRHSGSPTATIVLQRKPGELQLAVRDRGRGMGGGTRAGTAPAPGVGIAGMRERVRELGGEFLIVSEGRGTEVRVTIPVAGDAGAPEPARRRSRPVPRRDTAEPAAARR